jgi:hypothetical protein
MRGSAPEPPLPRFPSLPEIPPPRMAIPPPPREVVPWHNATSRYVRAARRDIAGEVLRFTLGAVAGMLAVFLVELVGFPPSAPADNAPAESGPAAAATPLIAEPRPAEPGAPQVTTVVTPASPSPMVLAQHPVPTVDVRDLPRAQARRQR